MKNRILACIFLLGMLSCSSPEPRRPLAQKTHTTLSTTTESFKKINALAEQQLLNYIANDSLHTYINSQKGYWYAYETKIEDAKEKPVTGDRVLFRGQVEDVNGNIIYSAADLGEQSYHVDKEDQISALQSGIKLMGIGETLIFAIPSHQAFGMVGDGKKIGVNQSLIYKVTLTNIIKQ